MEEELESECCWPLVGVVDGVLGLSGGEGCRGEAEGTAEEVCAATLRGEGVDVRVADHDRMLWGECRCGEGGGFGDEGEEAFGIGLLGIEGVAAVVLEEERRESEGLADVA